MIVDDEWLGKHFVRFPKRGSAPAWSLEDRVQSLLRQRHGHGMASSTV
jgi:hypothetical protein